MTTQNTPDTRSIVERKLSEIYTHITIPIPYEFYERYVEEAYDRLIAVSYTHLRAHET